jgi:hypothetical protein
MPSFKKQQHAVKPRYHITDFLVVATGLGDYRVDVQLAEVQEPVKGPTFPSLELAKDHIAVTQRTLAQQFN